MSTAFCIDPVIASAPSLCYTDLMIQDLQWGIALLVVIAASTLLGRRLKIPSPILLLVVGVGLSFVPGLPAVRLDPDVVLLIILPPLVYSAGVATSWPDFRRDLRPITLLAVGAVLFTTAIVAVLGHDLMGLPWASALLLGAVVSPPDVIAPMAVVGQVKIPRRLVTILNGEGLVNDVTALVLVAFATDAVVTGDFSAQKAGITFLAVLVGELAWGFALGWASLRLRRWSADVRVEITLSLLTPYAAFWLPHALGGSGVLAAAVVGVYASWTGPALISAATRLQGTFFWNLVVYLLTGIVFLLTGLQARAIVLTLQGFSLPTLALHVAAICAVAVLARFVWVFTTAYSPGVAGRGRRPGWRQVFLVSFTGIRGVVSLVAAFSIPYTIADGAAFPGRDMIVFLTFAVIVATLVAQGLALPPLIRGLGLDTIGEKEAEREEAAEFLVLAGTEERALARLEPEAQTAGAAAEVVADLRLAHETRRRRADRRRTEPDAAEREGRVELALILAQRALAWEKFQDGSITDEARRRIEHELDLEEARIRRAPNESIPDGN